MSDCKKCGPRESVQWFTPAALTAGDRDLIGHDAIGHRLAGMLSRERLPLPAARALSDSELRELCGMGPSHLRRLRHPEEAALAAHAFTGTGWPK